MTQNEDKPNKIHNTIQKTKTNEQQRLHSKLGINSGAREG
jgi:hypothetical protein